jgi:phosphotransferase system enzyme I (PtsP)
MFPMISSIDEFCQARDVVSDCLKTLGEQGMEHNSKPKLGIMVELPCVVDLIEDFVKEAEFFSIGTNDLIQFMLGVDRTNENIAGSYLPHHPSVLRALKKVVYAADKGGREVSVCGDMAHQEQYLRFLLGIGVRVLSIDPRFLHRIQQAISEIDLTEARVFADNVLAQPRISDITQTLSLNSGNK